MGDYTREEEKRIEAMKKKIKDLEKQRVDDVMRIICGDVLYRTVLWIVR